MNELTREIVTKVAKENKPQARKGGFGFDSLVMSAHWDYILLEFGVDLKQRALDLWRLFHPDHFEKDGGDYFLRDYLAPFGDLEIEISERVTRVLVRKVNREPELSLDHWGDLAERISNPQMELF